MRRFALAAAILLAFAALPLPASADSGTIAFSPAAQYIGLNDTVTATVTSANGGAFTIDFGDGSSSNFRAPAGTNTFPFTHAWAAGGTYTVKVTNAVGAAPITIASAPIGIVSPTASLAATPALALVGQSINVALTTNAVPGLPAAPTFVLDYGDGATAGVPFASGMFAHTYSASGVFAIAFSENGNSVPFAPTRTSVNVGLETGTLAVNPAAVLSGSPVAFTVTLATSNGAPVQPATLAFGDGTQMMVAAGGTYMHTYAMQGTFTAALTYGGTALANARVSVGAVTASLSASPASATANAPITYTATLSTTNGLPPPAATLNFGDGSSTMLTGSGTFKHAFTAAGVYTATIVSGAATLAMTTVSIGTQGATLTIDPSAVLIGAPATFTVVLTTPNGAQPSPVQLNFGDGSSTTIAMSGTTQHSYTSAGRYNATVALNGTTLASASVVAGVESGTVTPQSSPTVVGQPTVFSVTLSAPGTITPPPATLDFGDGSSTAVGTSRGFRTLSISGPFTVTHTYTTQGPFNVRLIGGGGVTLSTTSVNALQPSAVLPIGQIFSATPLISPVLAGSNTTIVVTYRITTPQYATNAGALQVIVDLLDGSGNLIRRADPFTLPYNAFAGSGVQSAAISYAVPVDANGAYQLRITIVGVNGGNVAQYMPIPFLITGGPDPAPKLSSTFKANGALEAGPQAGTTGNNLNMGLTTALVWPTYELDASGLFDPISRRSDPLLNLHPLYNGQLPSPDQTNQPGYTSDMFKYIYGRTQSALPALLGGGTTLRGLDGVYQMGGALFHAGYGYTNVSGTLTNPQLGSVFDIGKQLGSRTSIHAGVFHRQDSTADFNPAGGGPQGAIDATGEAFQLSQSIGSYVKLAAMGGFASSRSLTQGGPPESDTSDKLTASYQHDRTSFSFDYHNAGPVFAQGAGPASLSDRAGFAALAQLPLTSIASIALGWTDESARSVYSKQTDANAMLSLTPHNLPQFQLGYREDHALNSTSNSTSNQFTFNASQPVKGGAVSLALNDTAIGDALNVSLGAVTRSGQLQYQYQRGTHAIGLGISAQTLSGQSASSSVAESFTYGFPFGHYRRADGSGGFEFRFEANDTNARSLYGDANDFVTGAIVSYHLIKYVSIGIRADLRRHDDPIVPANSMTATALRFRLDLQQ